MKHTSFFVLGTDTGVGKTVITALLTKIFQNEGLSCAPFKPVATGACRVNGADVYPDIAFLANVCGSAPAETGLYRFPEPLSPHLAAAYAGCEINAQEIAAKFDTLRQKYQVVVVEGVGGAMVPLTADELLLDLVVLLDIPVILVARAGLGTINHTLLTVGACRHRGAEIAGLVINRYPDSPGEAERTNPEELEKLTKLPVIGKVPEIDGLSVETCAEGALGAHAAMLDLAKLRKPASYERLLDADKNHVWHPFTPMLEYLDEKPHPVMIVKGKGSYLVASDGTRYLDGVSSLWVNVHGHRSSELDEALARQAAKVSHSTTLGLANEPASMLAEKLAGIAPGALRRVFYSDSGSTAVEIGLKVAYQYWQQTGHADKKEFIGFRNGYHGDTLGAVSVGGIELFHAKFAPLLFKTYLAPSAYCYRCPVGESYPGCAYRCLDPLVTRLENCGHKTAAVVLEPKIQAAAGILVQPPGYVKKVAELCRKHNVLLILDEVATGFGRTARMFACEHDGVEPDILALAKGISGGYLPLGATLFREAIYESFLGRFEELKTFFHGHTYTGNPLACAVAVANLGLFDKKRLLDSVREKTAELKTLLEPLNEHSSVGDVRQCGLMAGIELVKDRETKEPFDVEQRMGRKVILKARERGVLIRPLGDVVVLVPPLAIRTDEIRTLVDVTAWAIKEVTGGQR